MAQFACDHTLLTEADSGVRSATQFLAVHTSEGALTVPSLLQFCANKANGASYNTMVDRQGVTGRSNDDQFAPWAAGYTGNDRGWHVCALGFARQSRNEWLSYTGQINKLAEMLAFYCRIYGIPPVKISAADLRAGRKGICGHAEISEAWHEVDHTDPGPNFPWDVLVAKTAALLNPTAPPAGGTVTPEQYNELNRKLDLILTQLGPWPQLGKNDRGQTLTLVDAIAKHTAGGTK
ncbi:N-acetylmuramoyl-L-alanine amidase [Prescottella agglutinans]|uniref:N-acetyl-anhydromuramyl-L-alanine amidase AmpD n=1 Tax=Prescottella agglutinans TaxID=1644129 RepID=A0ABT6MHG0_9NOCA|nr:N-acetylmuramoyl-L-alanine amidase [Prescottella agglutinans]MDH6283236.1 N-acetyl-anhydromuramyl-L-alanine amidase AmpD [Prescottella agglutinans]